MKGDRGRTSLRNKGYPGDTARAWGKVTVGLGRVRLRIGVRVRIGLKV